MNNKTYKIAKNRGYDGYQEELATMIYQFFVKKTGPEITVNQQLAKDLQKPVIKKIKRKQVNFSFKGNNWAEDLAEMRSLSSKNKNIKYLLRAIDVLTISGKRSILDV